MKELADKIGGLANEKINQKKKQYGQKIKKNTNNNNKTFIVPGGDGPDIDDDN